VNWLHAPIRKIAPAIAAQCKFGSDQKIWQLSLDQIERDTGAVVSKRYAVASEAGSSTVLFDERNVLYSQLRPYLNKVVIPDEPGLASTELVPLRPDSVVLIPKFLALYLRSPSFVNQAERHVTGTTLPRVSMSWFWEHLAPLPPPTEQVRIVEIVEDVERIRRLRRGADAVASRIVPALFLEYSKI
jgi:type I restriction enzyme, S subunit